MTLAVDLRKGWCPGALRPMESGDGLLLRVKPYAGALSVASLGVIASVAARFGSGEIDLTNRGNIQIRGLSDTSYPDALSALNEAGLVDENPSVEAVRNIVVDPLSGIDPDRSDVRDLAFELSTAMSGTDAFIRLPPKFAFSFSGKDEPRVGGRAADIMIATGERIAIWLDGEIGTSAAVARAELLSAIERLVAVFLRLRAETAHIDRMRDAVAHMGGAALFAAAGLKSSPVAMGKGTGVEAPSVGIVTRGGGRHAVGIGLPFGRIRAAELSALCGAAAKSRVQRVHIGPQRILVFACEQADELLLPAESLGLIVRADDPRLIMDVCPGAPACKNATTDTRRDAQAIVSSFAKIGALKSVHVSGCEKGCARQSPAALTLVGRGGRYDLVRDGRPIDRACVTAIEPAKFIATIAEVLVSR